MLRCYIFLLFIVIEIFRYCMINIIMLRHSYLVNGRILIMMLCFNILNCLDISYRDLWIICYELCLLTGGLDPIYKRNSVEFSINFQEIENLKIVSLGYVLGFRFSNRLWYRDALWVLGWISGNWISFKDMHQLSCVDLLI